MDADEIVQFKALDITPQFISSLPPPDIPI